MHTHTHSMSQLMKWEAEIPLQALFCSDYTGATETKKNEFNDTKSYESLEVMEAMAAFYQLAS